MAAILNFIRVVRANGGVASSFMALWKRDDLKAGNFVGEDEVGNKYYENDKYFLGKNRWVHYAEHFNWNYDPSQVSPRWSGWLHYRTDLLPDEDPYRPHYPWMSPPQENLSGTKDAYVPWSTTRPKIYAWVPPKAFFKSSRECCPPPTPCGDKKPDKSNPCVKPASPCEKPVNAFH